MNNLAVAYQDAGKLDLALPLFEETLKLRKAKLGPDHPDTLTSMNNLAGAYQAAGKLDLALPLFEETLKLRKAKLGPDHPDTLTSMNNLAVAYQAAGKLDLALPLFEQTLKLRKAKLGPDHPDTLTSMNNLAVAYQAAGKLDLAVPLFEETLKLRKAKLGPDIPTRSTHEQPRRSLSARAGTPRPSRSPEKRWRSVSKKLPAEIPANDWQRLHERGELYARGGQWQKAAADYAAAIKAHPEDHVLWYQAAAIWLEAGDQDAYRRHCQEMLRRFGETDDPTIAERTAKMCFACQFRGQRRPPAAGAAGGASGRGQGKLNYYRYFLLARTVGPLPRGRIRHRRGESQPEPRAGSQGLRPQARVPCPGDGTSPTGPAGGGQRTGPEKGPRDDGSKRVSEGRQREITAPTGEDRVVCHLLRREAETLIRGAEEKGSAISTHS